MQGDMHVHAPPVLSAPIAPCHQPSATARTEDAQVGCRATALQLLPSARSVRSAALFNGGDIPTMAGVQLQVSPLPPSFMTACTSWAAQLCNRMRQLPSSIQHFML